MSERVFRDVVRAGAEPAAKPVDVFLPERDAFIEAHDPYRVNQVIGATTGARASISSSGMRRSSTISAARRSEPRRSSARDAPRRTSLGACCGAAAYARTRRKELECITTTPRT
jgi:hypothetical protein